MRVNYRKLMMSLGLDSRSGKTREARMQKGEEEKRPMRVHYRKLMMRPCIAAAPVWSRHGADWQEGVRDQKGRRINDQDQKMRRISDQDQ